MTTFFRLVWREDKHLSLCDAVSNYRKGERDPDRFEREPDDFSSIPGSPFAYWVTRHVRETFARLPSLESEGRQALHGASSKDDFRFLRLWWEIHLDERNKWFPFSKGGDRSPFYMDISTYINWKSDAREIEAAALQKYPYLDNADWILHKEQPYFEAVIYQTLRSNGLALYVTPRGCIFGDNGFQIYASQDQLFALIGLLNSRAGNGIFSLLLGRAGYAIYRNGTARKFPVPGVDDLTESPLGEISLKIWRHFRAIDSYNETSHAFELPSLIAESASWNRDTTINVSREMSRLDDLAYSLFDLSDEDRRSIEAAAMPSGDIDEVADGEEDIGSNEGPSEMDLATGALSWAVGVAFGRFDWRLATGERGAPQEPEPFDPLPAKSPGMAPDGAVAIHEHNGILVEDQGHLHDLPRLIEEVFGRIDAEVPGDVRRWLQRDFFPLHLKLYSKSRRKAPIYWPISTNSGSYTLWLYYPCLTSQTLYTAVNDFIEGPNGKLGQVRRELTTLRAKGGARSSEDERHFEALQALELELIELRDTLLQIAPTYTPNHDDGVQITAAPLWQLFRHKPWQKVLKDTWIKLEKGDYDWAQMAMAYWPTRVREKCKTDKSLAIAHDLEGVYIEPEPKAAKARGRKKDAE